MKKDKAFKKKQESREDLLCGHGLKAIANLSQLLQSNPNTKKRNAHAADLMDLFKATHMKTQEKVKTKNGRNLSEVMEDLKDAIEEDEESADYVDAVQSEDDEVNESLDEEQRWYGLSQVLFHEPIRLVHVLYVALVLLWAHMIGEEFFLFISSFTDGSKCISSPPFSHL